MTPTAMSASVQHPGLNDSRRQAPHARLVFAVLSWGRAESVLVVAWLLWSATCKRFCRHGWCGDCFLLLHLLAGPITVHNLRECECVCVCVRVFVCECVGVWVCGCVGVWVCGCVGVTLPNCERSIARRPASADDCRHNNHFLAPRARPRRTTRPWTVFLNSLCDRWLWARVPPSPYLDVRQIHCSPVVDIHTCMQAKTWTEPWKASLCPRYDPANSRNASLYSIYKPLDSTYKLSS